MPLPKSLSAKLSREYLLLGAIMLLTLMLRLSFVHEPLDRDEGAYALLGQEILRGAVPYRDVIEIKPPGALYIFSFIMYFGENIEYIRAVTACYTLLTVGAAFHLARMLGGSRAGLLAALLCGIFTSGPVVQGSGSNTEVFLLLPVLLGAIFLLKGIDTARRLHFAASGLCFAAAVFIKTVAVPVYLLPLLFMPFIRRPFRGWRMVFGDLVAFTAPAVVMAFCLWGYLTLHDAWDDFIFWNITFNKSYGETTLKKFFGRLTSRGMGTALEFVFLWIVALPTACWLMVAQRTVKAAFLIGLVLATCVGVCMPGKFWPHYLIPLIPPLAVIAGLGLAELSKRRVTFLCALPFMIAALAQTVRMDYPYHVASPDEASRMKFGGDSVFVDSLKVAGYIRGRTSPADTIFQWGWEPEIYVEAGRRPPNRFISHILVGQGPDPDGAVRELVLSIVTAWPKYIIVQAGREKWPGYPELAGIIKVAYHQETVIGGMTLFRHNSLSD
jgi:4-amino-4-deoxy-L-arabinose transferase-like glycosyltransferase